MKLSELASSLSKIDKFSFRDRIGQCSGSEFWGETSSLSDIKNRVSNFIVRYPDQAEYIFRSTELRVGPAEFLMCYLFDNITLNYNRSTDLLWNGKPLLECKVGRVPTRGEWKGHIVDFTFGTTPASYELAGAMQEYRVNHIKYMGEDIPGFKYSVMDLSSQAFRHIKSADLTKYGASANNGKFTQMQETWAQNVHKDYIFGKQFLLFNTKNMKLSFAGALSPHQLSVYRVHHQIYAGVKLED